MWCVTCSNTHIVTSNVCVCGVLQGVLEIQVPIVRGSKCAGEVTIAPVLIQQVFPSVVERLLECSDSSILQVRGRLVYVCACVT